MSTPRDLLARLENYYDTAPRSSSRTEVIGPFTLFVPTDAPYPYYARPTLAAEPADVTAADVDAVRARMRELDLPEELEWVGETTPALAAAAEASGMSVGSYPLMLLDPAAAVSAPPEADVRLARSHDRDLDVVEATIRLAFMNGGVEVGDPGAAERDELLGTIEPAVVEHTRQRIADGRSVFAVARIDGRIVGGGSHRPVDEVTEVVGIGVLPAARRSGSGHAITARLVADARARGIGTIFLSAGSDDIARIYGRVGFRRVATACIATA